MGGTMKKLNFHLLMLLAVTACGGAHAADTANNCRLKGGDLVPLPAAACAKEGGTVVKPGEPARVPAAQLSADPKIAAAQRAILDAFPGEAVDPLSHARLPEGVDQRRVKFDGCAMTVEEQLHLDYGNLFSVRRDFRIISTVDFRTVRPADFGTMNEIESKGGNLKVPAVYVKAGSKRDGKPLAVSVLLKDGKTYRKFTTPGLAAYWSGPRQDLWMKDGYGYVWVDKNDYADTSRIEVVYLVNTKKEAAKLTKAFRGMQAACAQ